MEHLPEDHWFKSSHSTAGGECIEVAWIKNSFSTAANPDCVEGRADEARVLVRDTQNRPLGHLAFLSVEWKTFLHAVGKDEFGQ